VPDHVDAVNIADDFKFSLDSFFFHQEDKQYLNHVIIPEGMIRSRCQRLAEQILNDYDG